MNWKKYITLIYLEYKEKSKKAFRNCLICLCIATGGIIFSIVGWSKVLFIPSLVIIGVITAMMLQNRKTTKEFNKTADDTIKWLDDPQKYS